MDGAQMAGDGKLTGTPGEGAADGPGERPAADMVELRLTGEQIALLRREGEVRPVAAGEVLFREGDRGYDFIVILAGRVAIVDHQAGTERELATGGPGEFVAELILVGAEPHTGWLAGSVLLDDGGYLVTGPALGPAYATAHRGPGATTIPTCWRPARRACSPPAMSAAAR